MVAGSGLVLTERTNFTSASNPFQGKLACTTYLGCTIQNTFPHGTATMYPQCSHFNTIFPRHNDFSLDNRVVKILNLTHAEFIYMKDGYGHVK